MPAKVSTRYIGNPETDRQIHSGIEEYFKRYSGDWTVNVFGAASNDIWELTIKAPDAKTSVHHLHGHDDAHNPDAIVKILEHITIGYPSKKYLRFGPIVAGAVIGPWVGHIRGSSEWVNDIKDATADYEVAAKVTQEQLKNELELETTLEKVPDALQMIPKWVICKED